MKISAVTEFCAGTHVVEVTDEVLRDAGRDGLEAFVIWGGVVDGTRFVARSAIVPQQRSVRTEHGLHVTIVGDAVHRMAVELASRGEIPGIQVHSHPNAGYHSDADDDLAVVTKRGALSIVVPDLGAEGVMGEDIAVYRLGSDGWRPLKGNALAGLLRWGCDGPR